MAEYFIVVSGLPASGKSTLARQLASALGLPLLDKDEILERLFETRGIGDPAWRRTLSREADAILQAEASAATAAVLVSHWHLPGMPADSGTPTEWIAQLPLRVVHVCCDCGAVVAAERYARRARHPGHGDKARSQEEILAGIREIERLGPLELWPRISVNTSGTIDVQAVLWEIQCSLKSS